MIEVGHVLVHEDLISEQFVCNLNACKGACCIEGDAGAPLEHAEKAIPASYQVARIQKLRESS